MLTSHSRFLSCDIKSFELSGPSLHAYTLSL